MGNMACTRACTHGVPHIAFHVSRHFRHSRDTSCKCLRIVCNVSRDAISHGPMADKKRMTGDTRERDTYHMGLGR